MLWNEFVVGLDAIRVEIRSSRGLKAPCPATDPIYDKIHALLTAAFAAPSPTRIDTAQVDERQVLTVELRQDIEAEKNKAAAYSLEQLAAIVPAEEEKPAPKVLYATEAPGGGTMKVMARETKRVQRPVDIVEVTEKELAK